MSIAGLMHTSVSGMDAQSNRLSAVSINIANASTVGYKSEAVEFSSLVTGHGSGGVESWSRTAISRQGVLATTGSKLDLAVSGNGFMLVEDQAGQVTLTRAGAFVPDADGHLVNAAGFKLLGSPLTGLGAVPPVVNGTAGLEPITMWSSHLEAAATTQGSLAANLPATTAEVGVADLPSGNAASAVSSARTSVVVFGNLGEEVTLDVHYARTTTPGEWEVSVFDAAGRNTSGGFPYASAALTTGTLTFDANGQLSGPAELTIPVPGGASMTLDLAGTSQLAMDFVVVDVSTDGNPPREPAGIEFTANGTVVETYGDGTRRAVWQIPLATVASPDRLTPRTGTAFDLSEGSGDMRVGVPGSGGLGSLVSGALENSTVDLGSELTDMIEAQRNYSANSKVFQTGAEIMEILVNLKR